MAKLTDKQIMLAKTGDKDEFLSDGGGLYLRVRTSGQKIWLYRYKTGTKTRWFDMGTYPTLPLKSARADAAKISATAPRQQIMVSRSFGACVSNLADLSESVAYYAVTASEKLRQDGSVAASVAVHVSTNPFKDEPQYHQSVVVPLHPTDSTTKIVGAALFGLKQIYRVGFNFKKSGVMLMGLHPKGEVQYGLFDEPINHAKSDNLMQVMDAINHKMGKGSVGIAASGINHRWAMRRDRMSQNFTTDWYALPEAL